jgi:hypothetical protein
LFLKANHPEWRKTIKTVQGKKLFEKELIQGIYMVSDDLGQTILIEPRGNLKGKRKDLLNGMQIIYDKSNGVFEVSEYMAGPKQDKLYIYKETKSLIIALKDMLKGNHRKPIKVW